MNAEVGIDFYLFRFTSPHLASVHKSHSITAWMVCNCKINGSDKIAIVDALGSSSAKSVSIASRRQVAGKPILLKCIYRSQSLRSSAGIRQEKYARCEKYNSALSRVAFHWMERPAGTCQTHCADVKHVSFGKLFQFFSSFVVFCVCSIVKAEWMRAQKIDWIAFLRGESHYGDTFATSPRRCRRRSSKREARGKKTLIETGFAAPFFSHAIFVFSFPFESGRAEPEPVCDIII